MTKSLLFCTVAFLSCATFADLIDPKIRLQPYGLPIDDSSNTPTDHPAAQPDLTPRVEPSLNLGTPVITNPTNPVADPVVPDPQQIQEKKKRVKTGSKAINQKFDFEQARHKKRMLNP